ncbi:MAG: hypothetical protein L0Y72_06505 [Gemmataceae bacterium]|nr:hypothetical protein [Gemmataceae bacterium]MCI0738677.1 hypothetical protein [Gemmataceae bacterium]
MHRNPEKVRENIAKADTEDLLDRVTAFRAGMEPEGLAAIEAELRRRGVSAEEIADHRAECEEECLFGPDGVAYKCSLCRRPAVADRWGWHRLGNFIPLFPRRFRYCRIHSQTDG